MNKIKKWIEKVLDKAVIKTTEWECQTRLYAESIEEMRRYEHPWDENEKTVDRYMRFLVIYCATFISLTFLVTIFN